LVFGIRDAIGVPDLHAAPPSRRGSNGEAIAVRVLAIGDVVGTVGRRAVRQVLPSVVRDNGVEFVLANAENASGGTGLAPKEANELLDLGIHVLTGGNHTFRYRELYSELDSNPRLVRPANYPPGAPGKGVVCFPDEINPRIAVINLIGRTYMNPVDCPFRIADGILSRLDSRVRTILVDFHAEATSEKVAMGWHLNGRVTAVVGTHTHVQTADERVLDRGTAYITDLGMCGPIDSVLGVDTDRVLERFRTQLPVRLTAAEGRSVFSALLIDCSDDGTARSVTRISRVTDS
jgi:metallophosphoesterase (TIGR00282 family)